MQQTIQKQQTLAQSQVGNQPIKPVPKKPDGNPLTKMPKQTQPAKQPVDSYQHQPYQKESQGDNWTVGDQLMPYLDDDSVYQQQAKTQARTQAASRGLMNTSMAVQAAQQAAYNAALPMAMQDAQTKANWESQQSQQKFQSDESAYDRDHRSDLQNDQQNWQQDQNQLDREHQGNLQDDAQEHQSHENALDRWTKEQMQRDHQAWRSGENAADRTHQSNMQKEGHRQNIERDRILDGYAQRGREQEYQNQVAQWERESADRWDRLSAEMQHEYGTQFNNEMSQSFNQYMDQRLSLIDMATANPEAWGGDLLGQQLNKLATAFAQRNEAIDARYGRLDSALNDPDLGLAPPSAGN